MLSDTEDERLFLLGATLVTLSISTLQYVGGPLLGLARRGENNKYHRNLSMLSGFAFCIFLFISEYTQSSPSRTSICRISRKEI